jgi:uncharacterized repeat protein (TIGR01451 family)
LSPADWSQIRRLFPASERRGPGSPFNYEAQLFGHGDAVPEAGAEFGYSVAVDGDTVVVGAPVGASPLPVADSGVAWVFVRSGAHWHRQSVLWVFDGDNGDLFGASVSISGDTIVVGAPSADPPGVLGVGAAYVFVRAGTLWNMPQKLTASDGADDDHFGWFVSVDAGGDTIVVGAPDDDTPGGADSGSAYVFVRSGTGATWTEQQKLLASDAAPGDRLGASLALSGETILMGAPDDDTPAGLDAGSAYAFVRSGTTWTEQQKLLAADGAAGDSLGFAVSLSGDTAWIGAPDADTPAGSDAGAAYVFVRSGAAWGEQQKLVASDGAATDNFGASVSVSGETGVAGAPSDDTPAGTAGGSAYVFVRSGTTWSEQQKLVPSDGSSDDSFGFAVSISGDTVLAGAYLDDVSGLADAGSAYVLVRSGATWTEQRHLGAWDNVAGDDFGASVAMSGDTVVVGSYLDDTPGGADAGSAYVFVRSGTAWIEQQKLFASDGAAGDTFGLSVSLSGDTLVVGARYDDTAGGVDTGSAYVFVRSGNTWTEQQKLLPSDAAADDLFGSSVSLAGDTVAIGAVFDDTPGGVDAGSAYVFVRSGTTWTEQQKILASDGLAGDFFGYAAAISADTLVVGAITHDTASGVDAGSAYVFVRSGTTWTEQQKLLPADGLTGDFFGYAVSIAGDALVSGAPSHDLPAVANAGSAYVFVRSGTTWSQQQKLVASDATPFDSFGGAIALSSNRIIVGAPVQDTPLGDVAGSAYVFGRSGTGWIEQQKLLPPSGNDFAQFGYAVSTDGDTVVVGARQEDTPGGFVAGAVHVFRGQADLAVTKTDGQVTAVPGQTITYTIVASNSGPGDATSATVSDVLPPALLAVTWTCAASPGSSCAGSGSGNINDTVDLAAAGTATYTVTGTVSSAATGTLSNTVTVTASGGGTDPNPGNNSATDVDTLTPVTDLTIAKTDSADPVSPGDPLTYTLTISNAGPSDSSAATVTDALPTSVTFVSSNPPSPTCTFASATVTCSLGPLAAGASAAVTIDVTVNPTATGVLVNTATVVGNETDPDPVNSTATVTTTVRGHEGELTHGMNIVHDLAAQPGPVTDEDRFLLAQQPFSSYEVVVDATSGDIGAGAGPLVQRIGPDGTMVLQDSLPVGTGSSRTLRWRNAASTPVVDQIVRVRSTSCGTDCGPDDTYRIRAYETTYSVPRFNNSGTQVTVLVLQNPTSYAIDGAVRFQAPSGAQVGVHAFTLAPKATLVLNTATVPGANGVSGAITLDHDGRYGDLAGKTVALEPATGFSFDSALVPRPK